MAGLGDERLPAFSPPLSVVRPPRPRRPDEVAARTQACLETGSVKGGPWTAELTARLRAELALPDDSALLLTGPARPRCGWPYRRSPGRCGRTTSRCCRRSRSRRPARCWPSSATRCGSATCARTPGRWTPTRSRPRSPTATLRSSSRSTLSARRPTTRRLTKVCADAGVPLVADSAAALGARHQGRPVGRQGRRPCVLVELREGGLRRRERRCAGAAGRRGRAAAVAGRLAALGADGRDRRGGRARPARATSTCCWTGAGRSPHVTPQLATA